MKLIFFFQLIFLTNTIFAQTNFRNVSFAEALRMAKAEGKMVFMQFESDDCDQCNEVAEKGLEDKEVGNRIEQSLIALRITLKHPDRTQLAGQYNMHKKFGSLFIDMNAALVHKFLKTTTFGREYLKQIDLALYSTSESARITELEKEYKNGNRDISFLETLLTKRKSLNLTTDNLLDEYVALLPHDSLQSISSLAFIAQMAPMLDSKASNILRRDQQLFNKAWYSMSNPLRIGINNVIIHKGMKKAIDEKNEGAAVRVAAFAQGTYMGNYAAGSKAYDKNLLHFYEKTDTSKYFRKAIAYFDRYFMIVSPDSIKKIDTVTNNRLSAQAPKTDTIINGSQVRKSTISYAPLTQNFTWELNSSALNFYKMTNNPYLLSVATEWAKKGLEFFKSPEILDTYSRLLYKQNQKAKAIELQQEAIALRKQRKFSTKEHDIILAKMVKGETID
jgi:hypothetical protein